MRLTVPEIKAMKGWPELIRQGENMVPREKIAQAIEVMLEDLLEAHQPGNPTSDGMRGEARGLRRAVALLRRDCVDVPTMLEIEHCASAQEIMANVHAK